MKRGFYDIKFRKPKEDGSDESWWPTCGKMFVGDEGKITIHIDSLPLNFDGKLYVFTTSYKERKTKSK